MASGGPGGLLARRSILCSRGPTHSLAGHFGRSLRGGESTEENRRGKPETIKKPRETGALEVKTVVPALVQGLENYFFFFGAAFFFAAVFLVALFID